MPFYAITKKPNPLALINEEGAMAAGNEVQQGKSKHGHELRTD
jgi:hypothetical protein